ncbi:hypothetical protein [Pseudoalteromonas rubra]|uniref:CHASE2 domain-containing protein n=1 Tax=Pseudoalteromonas rubra TaxID=43658 RepID=A0A5S3WWY2_9GAMM|nr:hypothetical protein [Pseudoalteromonas rubra]TMP35580.1 hypothetical protein CWB98_16340 [Pseudoalteromonas rubra]
MIKRQKPFWSILLLFLVVLVFAVHGSFARLNAYVYSQFNQLFEQQSSDIVVIESPNLQRQQSELITQLLKHNVNAVVVLSDVVSKQSMSFANVYFPFADPRYCLPDIQPWLGYNMVLGKPREKCQNVWQSIYGPQHLNTGKLINFALSPSALPKFSSTRLLEEDVLLSQLEGKVVLIAQQQLGFSIPLRAPKLHGANNPVYLHAYVADSLEKEQLITRLAQWQSVALQLGLLALLLIVYQKNTLTLSIIIAACLSIAGLLASYVVMVTLQYLLPIGQLLVINLVTMLWVFFSRKWLEENELLELIANVHQRMMGRYLPRSISTESTPWDAIITLVNQQLALNRSIFLARLEGDHRLEEIRAINCHIEDIVEQRRDYQRPPYSDAIKAFGAVQTSRPFFSGLQELERQFVVPLMYAGDIRGFWAMTVIPNEQFDEKAFVKNVNRFASQIGELLFHYRMLQNQQRASLSPLTRALTLTLEKPLSQKVKSAIGEMEQKLSTLEQVFNQIRTAAVLFNLFGQVVQTNQPLEQLAKKHHLALFEMTALDLLDKITSMPKETLKGKLRYLTLQQGELFLPATLGTDTYILNIRSLSANQVSSTIGEPFSVAGILFEFIDITTLLQQLEDPHALLSKLTSVTPSSDSDINKERTL